MTTETKTRFTPLPWETTGEAECFVPWPKDWVTVRRGNRVVAYLPADFGYDTDDNIVLKEECRANAHLIAAAPALYHALERLTAHVVANESEEAYCLRVADARDALAAARGES